VSFSSPILLLCLLIVPVAVWVTLELEKWRARRSTAWAPAALQPNMVARPPAWKRHLPTALLLVGVAILLVGFARPKATFDVSSQEATLVLVLDVSGSMAAHDAQPTRLGAAKLVADQFVQKLPHKYRVSVVTFSDHSAVVAAPTHDLDRVRQVIANARTGPQGTALASAVVRAVQVGASVKGSSGSSKRPPAVVVVLSDGGQTAGRITPQQAVQVARKAKIPVAAALVGTPNGVVTQALQGGYTERIQVPADATTLRAIANGSGGAFYPSPATVDVKRTYDRLGSRVGKTRKTVEVTAAAAGAGLAFMLVGGLLGGAWFRRLP
jgi:Ca-activated chloride channel family protein